MIGNGCAGTIEKRRSYPTTVPSVWNPSTTVTSDANRLAARGDARPPLRVGIMIDSWIASAWIEKILRDIEGSDFAQVALVILNKDVPPPKPPVWRRLLTGNISPQARRGALFYFYSLLDARLFPNRRESTQDVDIRQRCSRAAVIEVMPEKKKFTDRFTAADVEAIRAHDLDVVFRFGFRIIRGDILSVARYGVWSYHHGDNLLYRGTPSLFWEMYEQHPVSGVVLQILSDTLDGGKVIYRSQAATALESLSRQRNAIYWNSASVAIRRLRDLHVRGWDYIASLETYNERPPQLGKMYHAPANFEMLPFLFRTAFVHNGLRVLRTRARIDSWSLAWRKKPDQTHVLSKPFDTAGFRFLRAPRDRYYADPCAITTGGRTHVFFEDFRYREQKGVISCAELGDAGPGPVETVLVRPYHLSYPFVFEHQGNIFMAPETNGNDTIELYRAVDFPRRWELDRVLIRGISAVDPTLFHDGERWWMFANITTAGGSQLDELHLFFADRLEGPWQSHPNNPIVSDVRRARPAGPLFRAGDALIRPAQDCSGGYGRATTFQKINKLTMDDYVEEAVNRVEPPVEPGNIGIHTYSFSNGFELIDVKRRVWRTASRRGRQGA
jgi:hypothetical protein